MTTGCFKFYLYAKFALFQGPFGREILKGIALGFTPGTGQYIMIHIKINILIMFIYIPLPNKKLANSSSDPVDVLSCFSPNITGLF